MRGYLKVILIGTAIFFILFGLVFLLASFSPDFQISNLIIAIVLFAIGGVFIGIVVFAERKETSQPIHIEQKLEIKASDLVGGDKRVQELKCKSCAGALSSKDLKITDLGVLVSCPYCGSAYAIEEAPKW